MKIVILAMTASAIAMTPMLTSAHAEEGVGVTVRAGDRDHDRDAYRNHRKTVVIKDRDRDDWRRSHAEEKVIIKKKHHHHDEY
jgi:Ni/Co efflux regulator RcnB